MLVAGIDVGKAKPDAHILEGSLERQFNNDKCGRRALRNWLLKQRLTRVVFEPTGRFHRNLHQCLCAASLETVLVNPLRSRRFAEALGRLAKNDRVDAAMLARFGLLDGLDSTPPLPRNLCLLRDLLALRRKLVGQLCALRNLRSGLSPEAAAHTDSTLEARKADIQSCQQHMLARIAAAAVLRRRSAMIESVRGCGPLTTACLCAELPELGTLGRRSAASLLGLGPFDHDSGQRHGSRRIRGGRAHPRRLLHMPAISALRCEPASKARYQRLIAAGKPPKVAIVAVMRGLACPLNTLLREDCLWQPEPPGRYLLQAAA